MATKKGGKAKVKDIKVSKKKASKVKGGGWDLGVNKKG